MTPSKLTIVQSLPLREHPLCLRMQTRQDLDTVADWPPYPPPYEGFALQFEDLTPRQRDDLFASRQADPHRITLIADHADRPCIAYLGLIQIDWRKRTVGNMGYRIHPAWCDQGFGTHIMRIVACWFLSHSFQTLRLDVVAANTRAIRCYEKVGFVKTGEFWKQDSMLSSLDLTQPCYECLRPHVRTEGYAPQLRFWWMELHHHD